ncbi:MAG: long-chain-fatty-acid--CoA ligase [Leptospiraceae bacterium]|nr:long-chain-fatty-acid--CoA ligase [Leptospiraceae bacterium]
MRFDYNHIPELIHSQAELYNNKTYLIFMEKETSYSQMNEWCKQLGNVLENKTKFDYQQKVGIFLPNSLEFVISFFGIMYAGGTSLPYNTLLKSEELEYQINHSDVKVLITNSASYKVIKPIRKNLSQLETIIFVDDAKDIKDDSDLQFWDEVNAAGKDLPKGYTKLTQNTIAGMLYTSGTTGKPKGCMLTHENYIHDLKMVVPRIELTSEDTNLCIMPLFHVNGQVASLLSTMITGGTLVLEEMFKPRTLIPTLKKYKCASFSAVPAMYNYLSEMAEYKNGEDLSFLKACICGAAPMPVEVFNKFESKFKGKIIEGYGLSEGTCVSSINPLHGDRKIGSIGTNLEGQEMVIMDDAGNVLSDGTIGEICVKGKNVMIGYYKDEESTKNTIVDGWLHTGDMGYRDRDGYFFITGRKKEMIIRGGENIYPKEIEEALYEHDSVLECAVIGLPDKKYGEQVVAVIRLKEGKNETANTIKQHLRQKIANFKMPNKYEFVLELPKTSTGKIQKLKLRSELIGDQKLVKRMKETLHIPYRWAYGKAMSEFFTQMKENKKIIGRKCPKCGKVSCPPKSYCGDCFVETNEVVELPDHGHLVSFTTIHMVFPGQPKEPPYITAWVQFEGTDSHLFHIINVETEEGLYVGKKVKAKWRDDADRTGSIYDIEYFVPVEDEEGVK